MLSKFCKFGNDVTDYCTPDCTLNPPGVPPMPMEAMKGMMAAMKVPFPNWESKFHGATKNPDGTYAVLTQQCLGKMVTDWPALGPMPAVAFDKVPEIMKTEALANPIEMGTFTIVDGKVKCAAYALDSHKTHSMQGKGSPAVEAVWGKKGDGSDVGFGAYFTLMGVAMPAPPKEPAQSVASTAVYDVAPAKAWKAISDWTAPYITPANSPAGLENVKGTGVDATRTVKMLDGSAQWNEKCTAFDDAGMTWSYMVTSPLPVPFNAFDINTFVCYMTVKPVAGEADKCEITIGAKYDLAEGVTEAPPIEPMYAGWAASAVEYAKTKC